MSTKGDLQKEYFSKIFILNYLVTVNWLNSHPKQNGSVENRYCHNKWMDDEFNARKCVGNVDKCRRCWRFKIKCCGSGSICSR